MNSIFKSSEEIALLALCEKNLAPLGFKTLDVDFKQGSHSMIRIFVEKSTGETINIDHCAEISRLLAPLLDNENWLTGPYDLEVSSPGLDRRLREAEDFERVVGEKVKIQLVEPIDGRGKIVGQLDAVKNGAVVVVADGKFHTYPLEKIKMAQKVWQLENKGQIRK